MCREEFLKEKKSKEEKKQKGAAAAGPHQRSQASSESRAPSESLALGNPITLPQETRPPRLFFLFFIFNFFNFNFNFF